MDDKVSNPPPNKYIYEFSEKLMHRQNENIPKDSETRKIAYKPMYPNFQNSKKHPKGLCVLCCFKNPAKGTNVSIAGTEGFRESYSFKPGLWKELEKKGEWLNKDGSLNLKKLESYDDNMKELITANTRMSNIGSGCKNELGVSENIQEEQLDIKKNMEK